MRTIALCCLVLFTVVTNAAMAEQVGDMDGDGQVGLKEAIIALQVVAGVVPSASLGQYIPAPDFDGDGVPDFIAGSYDKCQGYDDTIDTDRDGVPDECDICPGYDDSVDYDGDGIPDECDPKIVFVTSTYYDGSINGGGVDYADYECQSLATDAGLAGTYRAWLSTETHDAKDRITLPDLPYVDTTGEVIANDTNDLLLDGYLQNSIEKDENGTQTSGDGYVWTGTDPDGTKATYNCNNWEVNLSSDTAEAGWSHYSGPKWTAYLVRTCDASFRLYCFQQ